MVQTFKVEFELNLPAGVTTAEAREYINYRLNCKPCRGRNKAYEWADYVYPDMRVLKFKVGKLKELK